MIPTSLTSLAVQFQSLETHLLSYNILPHFLSPWPSSFTAQQHKCLSSLLHLTVRSPQVFFFLFFLFPFFFSSFFFFFLPFLLGSRRTLLVSEPNPNLQSNIFIPKGQSCQSLLHVVLGSSSIFHNPSLQNPKKIF